MGITNNIPPSRLIQPGVIDNAAARPASPFEGQCIFQKDTDQLLVWNGTAWVIPNQTTTNPEGLELVKVQTVGANVSSVTVNNAFSSTYDNYYITLTGGALAGAAAVGLQLGPSSVSGYNTGYYAGVSRVKANATTEHLGTSNGSNWNYITVGDTFGLTVAIKIYEPFVARRTRYFSEFLDPRTTDSWGSGGGVHTAEASFTDFLIAGGANLVGGTVRVYGYRNS